MSEHHEHHHLARASGTGDTFEAALFNAIAGLTDPKGHHPGLTFDSFEVIKISGSITHPKGDHGRPGKIRVLIEGTAHHNH
jgi:hypothetical protein